MKLLLDEMYPPALADALGTAGLDAIGAREVGLGGAPDFAVWAYAVAEGLVVLTENVADFVSVAADHSRRGAHHAGLIIALSGRFSRRPAGIPGIVAAIAALDDTPLDDRIVYLKPA